MNCLLLIDIQNDFLPGGSLAVPDGNEVIPVANALMPLFPLVVATQDWHPPDHGSFASSHTGKEAGEVIELDGIQQVLWPDHCVQGSAGANFPEKLNVAGIHEIVQKGTDPLIDSYSGFFDNQKRNRTRLESLLNQHNVSQVFIVGLATDYCVKFTAIDALSLGFNPVVVEEGCRGVEVHVGDVDAALDYMRTEGVQVIDIQTAKSLLARFV